MTRGEAVIGYYHIAGRNNFPENMMGNFPVYSDDKKIGEIEYTPDGRGNVQINMKDNSGKTVQFLGNEHDFTKEELGNA